MINFKYDGNDKILYHYTYYEYNNNKQMTGYSEINASSTSSIRTINNSKLTYKYDVEGNIVEIVYPIGLNDSLNQLTYSTEKKILLLNKTYTYDKNGNNTKEVDSSQNILKEMTYDVDNRLDTYKEIKNNTTTTQNNVYNGLCQIIQKTEGYNTINYFYQGSSVLYTTNEGGNKTSHNFVGVEGNTISTIRYNITGLQYYNYNKYIKGSTSNIIANNANANISYTYTDFGETKAFGDTDFYKEKRLKLKKINMSIYVDIFMKCV